MHTGTDQAREPQTAYYRLPTKFHKWNSPSFPDCIGNCSLAISDVTTIFLALLGSCSTTPTPFHRHFYLYIYGKCKNFHLFLFSFVCTHFCSFQIYETLIIQNNKKKTLIYTRSSAKFPRFSWTSSIPWISGSVGTPNYTRKANKTLSVINKNRQRSLHDESKNHY